MGKLGWLIEGERDWDGEYVNTHDTLKVVLGENLPYEEYEFDKCTRVVIIPLEED